MQAKPGQVNDLGNGMNGMPDAEEMMQRQSAQDQQQQMVAAQQQQHQMDLLQQQQQLQDEQNHDQNEAQGEEMMANYDGDEASTSRENYYEAMVQKMEIYREQCVMEGKLLDAEEAQSKIEELRDQEYNERRSAILTQNDIEMNELLEQKKEHIRDFERNWNEHEKQLVQSSQADLEALEQSHMDQLMQLREQFEKNLDKTFRFKPSASLLQDKQVFERLVQQRKYTEAHALREEFAHQEQIEHEKYLQERQKKIIVQEQTWLKKQAHERAALEKKLINQKQEQKRQRQAETKQLKKKFDNAIKEMEGRHNLSISILDSKFEKTISNRPRYQPVSAVKQSMSEKVMYSSMRSQKIGRAALMSARGRK